MNYLNGEKDEEEGQVADRPSNISPISDFIETFSSFVYILVFFLQVQSKFQGEEDAFRSV